MIRSKPLRILPKPVEQNDSGVAAVEFALTTPLFALLFVGIATAGISIKQRSDVREALRVGAQAAMAGEESLTAIQDVVLQSLNQPGRQDTVRVERVHRCGGTPATGDQCTDGVPSERYVIITINTVDKAADFGVPAFSETIEVRVE